VANNIIFVGFAFVVLLGTVFPLLYQAVNGTQVTVGTPYFAAVAAPAGIALLALMAVAPLVSWRSADAGVLWNRLRVSAWMSVAITALLLVCGVHHWPVLVAVFLAVGALGAAARTLRGTVLAAHRRGDIWEAWRAPSTAGMVVHIGIVILAIGIVVSTSYTTRTEVTLATGERTVVAGQVIGFDGFAQVHDSLERQTQLVVTVDGAGMRPAITTFNGRSADSVGTPAINSTLLRDVYVTFDAVGGNGATSGAQVENNVPAGSVVLGVTVEPLISWLWCGGLLVGIGSALSLGRRRHREEVRS
jgi:cytochrome c-type biogenesis protein CcmF